MLVDDVVKSVALQLKQTQQRIVFAESCTCGLIAATMSRLPGISTVLAGSAVVYQIPTKTSWLEIPAQVIEDHDVVSEVVAVEMARNVLRLTPHATISASITGHLGPDAPEELDGVAWCAIAQRNKASGDSTRTILTAEDMRYSAWQLSLQPQEEDAGVSQVRHRRQQNAVSQVLQLVQKWLEMPK